MILPIVDVLQPDAVALIAGRHGEVAKAERDVIKALRDRGVPHSIEHVDDWDIHAWHRAIGSILDRHRDDTVTVNLTAGHGASTAMLGIHAGARALPTACYDWETFAKTGEHPKDLAKYMHFHSPAAILNLPDTQPIDRQLLSQLLKGPQSVGTLAAETGLAQSSVSTSLLRLHEKGFVNRASEGRNRIYSIRPGVDDMLRNALQP